MNCHEFREKMSRSIDGGLDSQTRKAVGLHLMDCEECGQLIEGDKFWDEAVIGMLDREAPADLRAEILEDLDDQASISGLGRKKNLKLMAWAARRNNMTLRDWVMIAAIFAALVWLLPWVLNR